MKIGRYLLILLSLLLLPSCSQKAALTVQNNTSRNLDVTVDGEDYLLAGGEEATKEVDIGTRFIFGPNAKDVTVEGWGDCKLPFTEVITVKNDEAQTLPVDADAGLVRVTNLVSFEPEPLYVFFAPCGEGNWGEPLDSLPSGESAWYVVAVGCWNVRLGDFLDPLIRDSLDVTLCGEIQVTFPEGTVGRIPPDVGSPPAISGEPAGFRKPRD